MADIMVTLQKLANENTAKTFKFNKEEAATSRKWQEQMSATNHQREVKDLIAAGLNPVLSSGGSGASTPSTSSASGVADSAVNAIGNVQSSRTSAAAIRYSADRSLQAAQAAAAAQRYAADMAYKTQMDMPRNNPWALADKYISKNAEKISRTFNNSKKEVTNMIKNPKNVIAGSYLNENGTLNKNAIRNLNNPFKALSASGYNRAKQILMSNGYAPTKNNISAYVLFMSGDVKALNGLTPLSIARQSARTLQAFHNSRWNIRYHG